MEREGRGPSPPLEEELEPAISGSLMQIRSKVATSSAERSRPAWRRRGQWRGRRRRSDDVGGVLPVTGCTPSRSVRVLSVGFGEHDKLRRTCPLRPPPSFYSALWRGLPTIVGWAPPIRAQGGDRVGLCRWAESVLRSNPTFSPLISSFSFQLCTLSLTLLTLLVPSQISA